MSDFDGDLLLKAADGIADWINGAPCPDDAYYRYVVDRLYFMAFTEDATKPT